MVFVVCKVPLIKGTPVLSVDYLPQLGDQLKDDRSVDERSIYTHSQGME